jgi:hypothetical protein
MVDGKDPMNYPRFAIFHLPLSMQDAFFGILLT